MTISEQLTKQLEQIIQDNSIDKAALVHTFQDTLWQSKEFDDQGLRDIFSEIAYDLDYYEPKEERRKPGAGFYGNDRLIKEVNESIAKINNYLKPSGTAS